ncbi:hypothetical protein ACHAXT_010704 [Thalassiosira profunda]
MVRSLSAFLVAAAALASVDAFVPGTTTTRLAQPRSSATSLDAAPTMTALDTVAYAVGATDEVKGTGVWNAFELKREPKDGDEEKKED